MPGRVDELRALADAGDQDAAMRLAMLLVKQGQVDDAGAVLRPLADAGDEDAARRLVELLVRQGRVDELRAEVDAGTRTASNHLIALLAKQGKAKQAAQMLRWGLSTDGSIAEAGDNSKA